MRDSLKRGAEEKVIQSVERWLNDKEAGDGDHGSSGEEESMGRRKWLTWCPRTLVYEDGREMTRDLKLTKGFDINA